MIFIKNKYTETYFKIIDNARTKIYSEYTENHHVIPKSLGGTNDRNNIVKLSAREHFICHKLLVKMVTGNAQHKMLEAFSYFSNNSKRKLKLNSRQVQEIRAANAKASSIRNKGNQFYKKRKSPDIKLKQTRSKNASESKWINNGIEEKFSANHYELVEKSNFFYGRLEKTKIKLMRPRGSLKLPRTINKTQCIHCKIVIDFGNFYRWHGDNCKKKGV